MYFICLLHSPPVFFDFNEVWAIQITGVLPEVKNTAGGAHYNILYVSIVWEGCFSYKIWQLDNLWIYWLDYSYNELNIKKNI